MGKEEKNRKCMNEEQREGLMESSTLHRKHQTGLIGAQSPLHVSADTGQNCQFSLFLTFVSVLFGVMVWL